MTIERAGRALSERDFTTALAELSDGDGDGTARWLELRASAAYGAGEYEAAVAAWEQLHALHRRAGEREPAARAAAMTAMFLLIDAGMLSTVRGWARRAQRLLEGIAEGPVHALIAAVLGYERFFSGDLAAAAPLAGDAIRLGEHFDVMPAVAIGRTASGRIAVLNGDLDGGLVQFEEVAALLMSGDVDDLTTGMMYCELICAAQSLLRHDLAREWTDAMAAWSVVGAIGSVRGRCRVHQAELLRVSGPCDAAERTALQACDELRPWMRREFGWPLVELGLVRLRRGDLAGAEEILAEAADHAWPVHPGLALVRLEQGDTDTAVRLITSAIAYPVDAPSKELPPFGDLRMAPLLEAQSEIAAAAGDLAMLADSAERLARITLGFDSPVLAAGAALARARHELRSGDANAAVASARSASAVWSDIGAPFDSARARLVLADAFDALGDPAAAREALMAARGEFARYGAFGRVAAVDRRLGATHPTPAPSPRPLHPGTFRRDGDGWTVGLGGRTERVKDLKGLHYLHRMLGAPGREFHVLDLVAVESGTLRPVGREAAGLPVLDDASREAYRRRLAEIDEDIDDATQMNDLGRIAKAEADREYLITELSRAHGIGHRSRERGGSSERARSSVARMLRYSLDELSVRHHALAEHLRSSVRTGTYCSYQPDQLANVEWAL